MNRDIKFRAWDKQDKIMWEPLTLDDLIEGKWELQTATQESTLPWKDYLDFAHKDTIWMQFTGLKDKNGKEIYEGDILKRSREVAPSFVAVIEYKNGMFGGTTKPGNAHFIEMKRLPVCDYGGVGYDEVIGNIYETPELLSKQNAG